MTRHGIKYPAVVQIRALLQAVALTMFLYGCTEGFSLLASSNASSTISTPQATPHAPTHNVSRQHTTAGLGAPVFPDQLAVDTSTASHEDMHSVTPFVVGGARVRGPVSSRLQAELEQPELPGAAVALRGLLHGPKRPRSFPKCGACRLVRCNRGRTYCSGHCRQKRKLFTCDTTSIAQPVCIPGLLFGGEYELPTSDDYEPRLLPSIEEFDEVVLTAETPYMACAEFADGRNGCPARGTPAELPEFGGTVVLATRCRVEYYIPGCRIPLLPFGACECFYRDPRPLTDDFGSPRVGLLRGSCQPAYFPPGAGVGVADGVSVQPGGDVTRTSFFDRAEEPGREPEFQTSVTATIGARDISVSLSIFRAREEPRSGISRVLREGIAISAEYDYEPDPFAQEEDYETELADTTAYYQFE